MEHRQQCKEHLLTCRRNQIPKSSIQLHDKREKTREDDWGGAGEISETGTGSNAETMEWRRQGREGKEWRNIIKRSFISFHLLVWYTESVSKDCPEICVALYIFIFEYSL